MAVTKKLLGFTFKNYGSFAFLWRGNRKIFTVGFVGCKPRPFKVEIGWLEINLWKWVQR